MQLCGSFGYLSRRFARSLDFDGLSADRSGLSCAVMPKDPVEVDRLLDAGDLDGARSALGDVAGSDERFAVVRIKLGLYDGSIPSGAAMQALIQLMRRDPEWPGAKDLYQEASNVSYRGRESSVSHSHPPPPMRGDD